MQDLCFARKVLGDGYFLYEKHVNYLLKTLRKYGLPFKVAEAHRLSSLFFLVSGLDLLRGLHTRLSRTEQTEIIEWILSHQINLDRIKIREPVGDVFDVQSNNPGNQNDTHVNHRQDTQSTGASNNDNGCHRVTNNRYQLDQTKVGHAGFRATAMLNSDIPLDCGNISMTYCALATLVILGDDLSRVDRGAIIAGLRQLQLPDGNFKPSALGGECDMRLTYCATAVSALLNDWSGVDKDRCARFIKNSITYEGAFGQCPGAEAHGGSTYCALASLKLMDKIEETLSQDDIDRLIRWCLNRLDGGFSGRPNKDQDTCYSFWIGACLKMLGHFDKVDQKSLMDFILLAQEERGGLSKVPAFYSDPLHTYLGFAGLSFMDDHLCSSRKIDLLKLDTALNISFRAKAHLDYLHSLWSTNNNAEQRNDEIG